MEASPLSLVQMETERSVSRLAGREPASELRQLRYFVAVAEERHFGHAAKRLWIAQSGLSQQIKKLESALGVQLLVRDKRHVELTDAGQALLEQARIVLDHVARMEETVQLVAGGAKGSVRLGTTVASPQPLTTLLIEEFRRRFPDVKLHLQPGFEPQTLLDLLEGRIDLAVVNMPFEGMERLQDPRYLPLGAIEVLVMMPAGHRLASLPRIPRSELMKEQVRTLARSVNPFLLDHVHRALFGTVHHPYLEEISDTSLSSRVSLVETESVLSIGFEPEADLRAPGVVYRSVEDPKPQLEYGLVWSDVSPSPFVHRFVDVARSITEEASGSGPGPAD
jgi:DNA-binding transcriptional LysR family regulator